MTNVSATPSKVNTRRELFSLAEETLKKEGWTVTRVSRGGKASLREIARGNECHRISIRTSQDAWIAFPPKTKGAGWVTLDEVDYVVAASLNDRDNPTSARIHMIPGDDARDAFNRALKARKAAGYALPNGRGIWISLYEQEASSPVTLVGAGLGVKYKPIGERDLLRHPFELTAAIEYDGEDEEAAPVQRMPTGLTISDAKRLLAESLGVPEGSIRITIEH